MQPDIRNLQITEQDLERITGKEISTLSIGSAYRISRLRKPKYLVSFLLSEAITLFLISIFSLPISILIFQSLGRPIENRQAQVGFTIFVFTLTLILFTVWNLFAWVRSKKMTCLSYLLDEVDRYNQVLVAVDICDRLKSVGNQSANLHHREDILQALELTRDSLICGLTTEKILREHRNFLSNHRQLFDNIEQNLIALESLEVQNQADQYSSLLKDALVIGMNVQREMLNLQTNDTPFPPKH
ncbi:hypothetical protein B9G53_03985 [Pseudanabaena sp. SR411]|uniref:hypothetical protein n=1 Tax=Pseudanabaena sp. SR411 TaxID=1980935 RepID=UPI000B98B832|nr:hypothetical protein [Pseudanabaena sp. SR411]OYQ66484.1 hypothetical protein B9G53_03985 [Pseudanabaena sp. SR411]